jgi:penicillin-binding protein 1B
MAVAGKTGTSHDGWFAGYTPHLVCVVWVGFDDNTQLGLSGAASALPIWQEFMQQAVALRPELGGDAFLKPDGITTVEIDPDTGLLATPDCPQHERIAMTPALAPIGSCFMHQPPLQAGATNDPTVKVAPAALTSNEAAIATNYPTPSAHEPVAAVPLTPTQIELNEQGKPRLTTDLSVSNYSRRPQR